MATLPRPDVTVTTVPETQEKHVVISRNNASGNPVCKTYPIEGTGEDDRIKGVVEKIINDRHTGEWLP